MTAKKNKKNEKKEPVKIPPKEEKHVEEEKGDFNFGGLPQRDLKKNLGCG